ERINSVLSESIQHHFVLIGMCLVLLQISIQLIIVGVPQTSIQFYGRYKSTPFMQHVINKLGIQLHFGHGHLDVPHVVDELNKLDIVVMNGQNRLKAVLDLDEGTFVTLSNTIEYIVSMRRSKGKTIANEEQAAQSLLSLHTPKRRSITDQFILQRRTAAKEEGSTGPSAQPQDDASTNIVHESSSPADAETGDDSNKTTSGGDTEILHIDEDQGKDVDNQVDLEENTAELDQGQAGSDSGKTPESRPPLEQEFMEEDQLDQTLDLKLPVDEHVILEEPLSSSRTLLSKKNLDDAYTFGDQFLNEESIKDEPGKLNMNSEVVSIVTETKTREQYLLMRHPVVVQRVQLIPLP
nr:hypothetical protein [Tanacetum cinerariifolium]